MKNLGFFDRFKALIGSRPSVWRRVAMGSLLTALLVVLAGCGGGGGGSGAKAKGAAGVTEITIEGFEYGFDPEEFSINRGDTVRVIFRNTGILAHDWAIPDWNITTPEIAGGQEATLEFKAEQMGSIRFICTVPGHETLGMWGTLEVR